MNLNHISVTRSVGVFMRNAQYSFCEVRIPRNYDLDKLALLKPKKCIARCLSTNRLPEPELGAEENPVNPKNAALDMEKVRSILKKPVDKPASIFGRRRSLGAHVKFNVSNTVNIFNREDSTQNGFESDQAGKYFGKLFFMFGIIIVFAFGRVFMNKTDSFADISYPQSLTIFSNTLISSVFLFFISISSNFRLY